MIDDNCTQVFESWDKHIRHQRTYSNDFKRAACIVNNNSGEITVYAESVDLLLRKMAEKFGDELRRLLQPRGE
jgi:hypothetical protein